MTGGDSTDAAVSRPSRRALLAALGTGAVGGLAGCALGSNGGSTPPTTDAPTATDTSAATPTSTPTRTPVPEEPTPATPSVP